MKLKIKLALIAGILLAGCAQSTTADAPLKYNLELVGQTSHRGVRVYEFRHETGKCFVVSNGRGTAISCL